MLKVQNFVVQVVIQGVLNGLDYFFKDFCIRRQYFFESVFSINSVISYLSIGSGNDVDFKKKKKKNWLRSFFK